MPGLVLYGLKEESLLKVDEDARAEQVTQFEPQGGHQAVSLKAVSP